MKVESGSYFQSQVRLFRCHTLPQFLSRVISSGDGPIIPASHVSPMLARLWRRDGVFGTESNFVCAFVSAIVAKVGAFSLPCGSPESLAGKFFENGLVGFREAECD